jgi:hypothetical protein
MKKLTYFIIALFVLMLTYTLFSTTKAMAQVYPEGMISYWKFEENGGLNASDSVDANNGTIHGATWTTGKVGGALEFSGYDHVTVPIDSSLSPSYVTIEAWVYPTTHALLSHCCF